MKRPSFQFYPADWQANSNLRRCTHEEKGIWIDVMCLLHDQEEYGVSRWPLKEIAQAVGCSVAKLKGLVTKGVIKGADTGDLCDALIYVPRSGRKNGPEVTLIEKQEGPVWYSSRMVIDEYKRVLRGELGSTPKATPDHSPKVGLGATPKATPDHSPSRARASSSSSSSPSVNPKGEQAASTAPPLPHDEPPPTAALDPITYRSIELVALLKRGAALQASNPIVREWAARGITDAQALTALEIAEQRRSDSANPQAINAGFLNVILSDVIAPKARASPPSRNTREARISNYAAEAALARGEHENEHGTGRTERDITGESVRIA